MLDRPGRGVVGRPGRLRRRERAGRHRGAVGDPRLDGRDADPERRRLRPGGRADDHRRPRLRPRGEGRADADPGRVRVRLPRQPAQAGTRPVRRPGRHLRAGRERRLAPGRLRGARPDAGHRDGGDGAAGRGPRGRPRAAPRQGHGARPRRSRQPQRRLVLHQPDRARGAGRRRLPELAGRRRAGQAQRRLARPVRRLRQAARGGQRRDVVPPQPRADDGARRDRRRSCSQFADGVVGDGAASGSASRSSRSRRRSGPSSRGGPCAGRPARAGGSP